ncbi:MAG: hypothetical protein KAS67_04235 [Thermoplasmata archaeon]|nr:hypothetical protein [Thermoplasmata archaeon]
MFQSIRLGEDILYPPEPESKFRETLRYLGYTLGSIGGLIILALIFYFIEPIIEVLLSIMVILIFLGFIGFLIVAVYYLFLRKDRP